MSIFVCEIDRQAAEKMQHDLEEQGFTLSRPPHTLFAAKKEGVSCTAYESGKLVVQGKNKDAFIEFYLEPTVLKEFTYTHGADLADKKGRIGSDETGKGDFFGPLCVACVFAEGESVSDLVRWGVKDSKSLSDEKIVALGKKIEKELPHHIVIINPPKYNEMYEKFRNLNTLLAWAHATAIEKLIEKTGCKHVIVDQFAKEYVLEGAFHRKGVDLHLIQRTKGEEDVVVAAASILARKTFVERMKRLGLEYGMELPKGASSAVIKAARRFVEQYGKEALPQVAKMHFKSTKEVIG